MQTCNILILQINIIIRSQLPCGLGIEISGEVVEVGSHVSRFIVSDELQLSIDFQHSIPNMQLNRKVT